MLDKEEREQINKVRATHNLPRIPKTMSISKVREIKSGTWIEIWNISEPNSMVLTLSDAWTRAYSVKETVLLSIWDPSDVSHMDAMLISHERVIAAKSVRLVVPPLITTEVKESSIRQTGK